MASDTATPRPRHQPILTWTLIGLNVLVYLWDRGGNVFGTSTTFADLALRPSETVLTLYGRGDALALGKIFTSMFLHGNLGHLVGNVLFLNTFGPSVERALSGVRFALYYLFWGVVAAAAHVYVNQGSDVPTLGASGAIGGVLGAFFILFPASKIEVFLYVTTEAVPAWLLLGAWFVWQILFPQQGVANWAHVGGFMAGMATILLLGGRKGVLKLRPFADEDDEPDE
ncbi:MAG: rhomboid family intramembrane serine protease [Armatimonadetes bacterium]|nr:rhomboid family intramembrane serine protease [Armatimonadota bacterium]